MAYDGIEMTYDCIKRFKTDLTA